jgi:hypothetical protein
VSSWGALSQSLVKGEKKGWAEVFGKGFDKSTPFRAVD